VSVALRDLHGAVPEDVSQFFDRAAIGDPVRGECMPRRLVPGQVRKAESILGGPEGRPEAFGDDEGAVAGRREDESLAT
jgi:hypothetical protein